MDRRALSKAFAGLTLLTHEGRTVRFYDDLLHGRCVVISFMYTRCTDLCGGQTANLVRVQRELGAHVGRDVFMYSITLEPGFDTAERLRRYAEERRVGPGWLFLTGAPPDIRRIREQFGFVDLDPRVDGQRNRHLGMVLYGMEPLARWAACPVLMDARVIAAGILSLTAPEVTGRRFRKS